MPISFPKLSQNSTYWLFQIGGWSAMLAYEVVNYMGLGYFSKSALVGIIFMSCMGLISTHLYRSIVNRTTYFSQPLVRQMIFFPISLFSICVLLALSAQLFSWILSKPPKPTFDQLSFLMNVLNWSRYIAVWLLIYFLFKYMRQKMQTDKAQLRTTVELQHAQLEILRLQLNPHFLFNALNSIRSLIITDAEQARAATTLLSQLLRHTLNYEKQQFITLDQEIGIVKDYLSLEKIRFDERLHFLFEVPTEALPTKVPPSILLTLAENAIKHGISRSMHGGTIEFAIQPLDRFLMIKVTNTGQLQPPSAPGQGGIGITNLNKRLKIFYKKPPTLQLINESSNTVAATLQLPILP